MEKLWQTKLAARIHDPAEKALVLLRDPSGHEGGTVRILTRLLGFGQIPEGGIDPDNDEALVATVFKKGLPKGMYETVRRADWWAAAADRPQWPMEERIVQTRKGDEKAIKTGAGAEVRWTKQPQLIHPLSGAVLDLGKLVDTDIGDIKQRSFDQFSRLIQKNGDDIDFRRTLLAYWRFGPEISEEHDNGQLGALWPLLPADTRVPDHSIWDHLDLTSAFAGAFAGDPDGEAALLALSIGPVQSFIAAARKLDDLWAGSHLLSCLAWETMRPIAEALGPDAILFPRLRGIAQVDLWLKEQGLNPTLFSECDWNKGGGADDNPLFAAALPNRFVAVVPASRAAELARQCETAARQWMQMQGEETVHRLLDEAGIARDAGSHAYQQAREQLAGFPEVHWAAVPFSLIRCRDVEKQRDLNVAPLLGAMAPFFGVKPGKPCGFLDSPAWKALSEDIAVNDGGLPLTFFAPNPGALYPAVYDLAERVLAAAKAVRAFDACDQQGWRDSLTGEAEWLTDDPDLLTLPPGQRKDTLWTRVAKARPAWAKKGEHLGALSAIKRLWPTRFAAQVAEATDREHISRFVVSTHTMALAGQIDAWIEAGTSLSDGLSRRLAAVDDSIALPRRLVRRHKATPESLTRARRMLCALDTADDAQTDDPQQLADLQRLVKASLAAGCDASSRGGAPFRLETYYGLIQFDGDRMGAILSGDEKTAIPYRESFHPKTRDWFDQAALRHPDLALYGQLPRAVSPGRHLAISAALNDFSQIVARHVVEEEHLGRLIYAGGDDVLAVIPAADLLSASQRLRYAYSGTLPEDEQNDWGALERDRRSLHCKNGFAWLRGRLMRMMGPNATASAGVIVAHHQAPLSAVLRQLRETEQQAKGEGGRDALAIRIIKRSGGTLNLALKWPDVALLEDCIGFLRDADTSRRAVYHSVGWLDDLPDPAHHPEMLTALLAYQFGRQSGHPLAAKLPVRLVGWAEEEHGKLVAGGRLKARLANLLQVAEFLAREVRSPAMPDTPTAGTDLKDVA